MCVYKGMYISKNTFVYKKLNKLMIIAMTIMAVISKRMKLQL